jgi:hypothetical protein
VKIAISPKSTVRAKEQCEQPVQQQAGANVQEDVAEVKTGCVGVPEKVIDHVGKILHRPVMTRIRVEKEIVAKCFEREQRAFDEWVVSREEQVVPYWRSLDGGQSHE